MSSKKEKIISLKPEKYPSSPTAKDHRYDVILKDLCIANSSFVEAVLTEEEIEALVREQNCKEAVIAYSVSYTEARHVSQNLEKNGIRFEIKPSELDPQNDDVEVSEAINSKNIALWTSLQASEDYKLTAIDSFFLACLLVVAALLIFAVVRFEKRSEFEIHHAVYRDQLGQIQIMLYQNPALVFKRDEWGRTPIYYLKGNKALKIAEILLVNGAKANVKDKYGRSPLYYIEKSDLKDKKLIMYLLSHKYKSTGRNEGG